MVESVGDIDFGGVSIAPTERVRFAFRAVERVARVVIRD